MAMTPDLSAASMRPGVARSGRSGEPAEAMSMRLPLVRSTSMELPMARTRRLALMASCLWSCRPKSPRVNALRSGSSDRSIVVEAPVGEAYSMCSQSVGVRVPRVGEASESR